MTKKQKRTLTRILIAAAVFAAGVLSPLQGAWQMLLFLPAYLIAGGDVLRKALTGIKNRQMFDENFLMMIATVGAFLIGEYPEGVMVMVLYQVGELFQSYAVGRSRRSIAALMDIRPDCANVERDGELVSVDPDEVEIGEIIVIKAGEKIPLDGVVIEGSGMADTSALTGESVPREIGPDSEALSGCINLSGVLRVRVTKEFGESTVSRILDLVENAASRKAKTEAFITRFARYYTPCVVIVALLLALIPPLLIPGATFADWVYRALTFLVISCPCALVISVPLGFFGGIGGASRLGILIKGSNYLEALAYTETVVFDKTGTLTEGSFRVTAVEPVGCSEEGLLEIAALAECYSNHPISLSLRRAYGKEPQHERVSDVQEVAGGGVVAVVDGHKVLAGNARLMERSGIQPNEAPVGTVVHLAVDSAYAGYILIADAIKPDAARAIHDLHKAAGVRRTAMLTGDNETAAQQVGKALGLITVYAQLLPGDKVARVEQLLAEKSPKATLAFVGDGINDAPVLSRADIGIAMGGLGSDAAIEAADIVIMDDKLSGVVLAIRLARRTMRIVRQNIVFALGIKGFFLLLGAMGVATMWEAVFADVGVSVLAILNAMRALNVSSLEKAAAQQSKTPAAQAEKVSI